jgi:hypothetical protein
VAEVSSHVRAKLLGGPEVQVLEISRQSLVLHSGVRLRPGFGINLTIVIGGVQHEVRGRIVAVDAALAAGSLHYRVGVKLDQEVAAFDAVSGTTRSGAGEAEAAPAAPTPAPKPAPPAPESKRAVDLQARLSEVQRRAEQAEAQAAEYEARVAQLQSAGAQAHETLQRVEEELAATQQRERLLIEHSKSAEASWQRERDRLQLEVAQAQVRIEQLSRSRDEERDESSTQQARLAADLEALTQERVRLQNERTQAEARAQEGADAHERERAELIAQRDQLASRLEATEKWCAEQQELLYQIQRHVGALSQVFEVSSSQPEGEGEDGRLRQATA